MNPRLNSSARLALVSVLTACAALAGCGYNLVGRASNLPPDIKKIYIKPIENKTSRQQVDQILTTAIANEMVKRQRFALTTARDGADAELSGQVTGFGATPVTFDQGGRATSYEISLTAAIKFSRISDSKIIWQNKAYNYKETYAVDPSAATYFDRENEAILLVAKNFSETMVSDLLEGF
jgi:outer membrane lipopolysaccharide assembly protein LptE/RlpB